MSCTLVSRSPDLSRLRDEGFDIEIRSGFLVVKHVPFVNSACEVDFGTIVSELTLSGDVTAKPGNHMVSFIGGIPCNNLGAELNDVVHSRGPTQLSEGMIADCAFSNKPLLGYSDYYEKVTSYVYMLSGWAQAIDPSATAKTFPPVPATEEESVFRYVDTASSRAKIADLTSKLAIPEVAIVGLGGTGSYILDLIAKTPIKEIHLYDHDVMLTHNAFRAPGAASLEELQLAPSKVEYYQHKYDAMRRSIFAHRVNVDETNVDELGEMSFVFLAMDSGAQKKLIIEYLETHDIPFIDSGMGVYRVADSLDSPLGGIIRVTASTAMHRRHIWDGHRISFDEPEGDAAYDDNIQVADLNALNAALAVIKWKKLLGFYADLDRELHSVYTIDGNHLLNEDRAT